MSLVRLNAKSRSELETRVLAAALKQSLEKGDSVGAQLAHQQLSLLLKMQKEGAPVSQPAEDPAATASSLANEAIEALSIGQLPDLEILDQPQSAGGISALSETAVTVVRRHGEAQGAGMAATDSVQGSDTQALPQPLPELKADLTPELLSEPAQTKATTPEALPAPAPEEAPAVFQADTTMPPEASAETASTITTGDHTPYSKGPSQFGTTSGANQTVAAQTTFQIITSENTTIEGADAAQSMSGVMLQKVDDSSPGLQYHALYRQLQVSQMSSYDEIHKSFLRLVRRQLRELIGAKRPRKQELLGQLRQIWIAHDILTDPITRTDYDFRDLGLRGDNDLHIQAAADGKIIRPPSRIGELLQCAGLLEEAELDIACDMHKAMPEVQFGTFLVKQGFIGERDLESVLIGQKLLRAGTISVAQFQVAMELSQSRGLPIRDTLLERGYVSEQVLEEVVAAGEKPSTVPPLAVAQLVDVAPTVAAASLQTAQTQARAESEARAESVEQELVAEAQSLQLSNAVPSWKDQLDWDAPDTVTANLTTADSEHQREMGSHGSTRDIDTPLPIPARPREINIANAAPSWKDQLDWEDDSSETVTEEQPKIVEEEPASVENTSAHTSAPNQGNESQSDFFSHMRNAHSIFEIDNPLPPHLAKKPDTTTNEHPTLNEEDDEEKKANSENQGSS